MKLIILDPDLTSFGGHNFNYLDGIVREARARGIETRIFGYRGIEPAVAGALGASGHFTTLGRATITDVAGPPEIRRAWTHVVLNEMFGRDLVPLTPELGFGTLVFVPAATSRQLSALAAWLALVAPASLPQLVCLFRYDLDAYPDEREMLALPARVLGTLARPATFCCETRENAERYEDALGYPVKTAPLPLLISGAASRAASSDPVVGYFGDARHMKGSHLLPGLCETLIASGRPYRLCIQTFDAGADPNVPRQIAALRQAAVRTPEATRLIDRALDILAYQRLLRQSDIVLLPYQAPAYRRGTSAIFAEAVSIGRVMVVPEDTWMSATLRRYGIDPVTFRDWTVKGVHAAVTRAAGELGVRSPEAREAAARWNAENSPQAMVAFLLHQHRSG